MLAIESLRGHRKVRRDAAPPPEPEEIADAKGWISETMEIGVRYGPVKDQAGLAQTFDFSLARTRSSSFDKFFRDAARLLRISSDHGPDRKPIA